MTNPGNAIPKVTTILVFGDSIAWGAWDPEGGGVRRLRRRIDARNLSEADFYSPVYNLGVSNDTSMEVLARFETETKARLKESHGTVLIIAVGDNDASYLQNIHANRTPPDVFRKNTASLIKKAKKLASHVVLLSPLLVNEKKTKQIPWNTDISYRNADLKAYASIIREESHKEKI